MRTCRCDATDRLDELDLIHCIRHGGRSGRNACQPNCDKFREIDRACNTAMAKDRAILAAYCNADAMGVEAIQAIQTYGAVVNSQSGYPVQSPCVAIANRQA